jgi:mycothione reductase
MKKYDLMAIGTGSAMSIVEAMIQQEEKIKIAVMDKDEPGGICLTRGCIPSKLLLYPAELVRTMEGANELGIEFDIKEVNFHKVLERMRAIIRHDIDSIREGLRNSRNIDYYPTTAEFVAPYTLKVGEDTLTSKMIFLCTGSRPAIPGIRGLAETGYLTSDTVLQLEQLPPSIAIIGGGYIAAEYGHFFSAMGSEVSIIGRNPQFLPEEEPEVSALAKRELGRHLKVLTNCEVQEVRRTAHGEKEIVAINRSNAQKIEMTAHEVLVATGREPNTDLLHPERGGVRTDERGWIIVDEHLETSQPNVYALGDADGRYLFKHVANYEAMIVYYNAIAKKRVEVDYHAVPHAVFTHPEIASVGLTEREAMEKYDPNGVLIGIQRYEDTAKGEAMAARDYFVKVLVAGEKMEIIGAHIVGPYASILIQEVIDIMYAGERNAMPIIAAMHIHPSLSEVVQRAFNALMTPEQYHHMLEHHYRLPVQ